MSSYLILRNNSKPFLDRIVTCDENWILYDNWRWPRSVVEPRRSSKAFAKTKLTSKKNHCHCLVVCCPSDPLQLSESQWNYYIWEACSKTDEMYCKPQLPQPAFVNRMSPILLHDNAQPHLVQPVLQKLNKLGHEVLPSPPYSPDLLPTDYHFSTTVCRENVSTTSRKQKMLSKCSLNPEAWMFML